MIKIDLEKLVPHLLESNKAFVEDPEISPAQFIALMNKHEAGQCGGSCGFCKVDQDAAAFVIADNAAASLGKVAVPFGMLPGRTVH